MADREEPLYNIGAVSRITGIPEATLRVWERRYGFPTSSRTSGGHRIYSEKEVARLHWVKKHVEAGMQISQAVRALESMEESGESSSVMAISTLIEQQPSPEESLSLKKYHDRLLNALLDRNSDLADRLMAEIMALHPLETLLLDVIRPVMADIGTAWADGQIDVATEHFATAHLRHHLQMWLRTTPPPYPVRPVVLACAPDELHEGGLLIFSILLRRLRWPVHYLGAAVPLPDLAQFIQSQQPDVVVLVATMDDSAVKLLKLPDFLSDMENTPLITWGGQAFINNPALVEKMPGQFLGCTLQSGLEILNRILRKKYPLVK